MKKITGISSTPKQTFTLTLDDNSNIDFSLEFFPNQLGWYLKFKYENTICETPLRVCVCPNLIREYKNTLPFGFMFTTTDMDEIFYLDDFESGRASFYLLNSSDVQQIEDSVYAKI